MQILRLDPAPDSLSGLLRDLEPNGTTCLPLNYGRPGSHPAIEGHVLEPSLYDFLLFLDPYAASDSYDEVPKGRMRFEEVATILKTVTAVADIVGLAITEYMPWSAIKLSRALRSLPLLGNEKDDKERPLIRFGGNTLVCSWTPVSRPLFHLLFATL